MVRLGDMFDLQMGKTPSRDNAAYWNDGIYKWISIADIGQANKYITDTKETITQDAIKETGIKLVPKNTVIMSFKLSLGKTAITSQDMYTNEAIMAFHNKGMYSADIDYLYHLFRWFPWELNTNKAVMGATLNKATLSNIKIPLPPLDEQKRIAKNLDLASEIAKGYKEQLVELDKLVQAVFYEMFGESKTNSMQWKTKKLGGLGKVGSSKRVFTEELVESGIPFYRGTEIGALATKQDISIEYFITEEHYNELCKVSGRPAIGDLLMPSICSDGRIWRVDNDEPFYFKDGRVLWVHFSEQVNDNVYIQFALREKLISDYSNIASGTTFAELKIFALKNVDIMLPPLPLQTHFASIVTDIEVQKAKIQQALTEAENLFNSLMQEYFE